MGRVASRQQSARVFCVMLLDMKTSQRGFVLPLLIIIIAALFVGGYVYRQTQRGTPSVTETSTTQTLDSKTADSKTYTNNQYGFSLQYPSNFVITEQNSGDVIVRLNLQNHRTNADAIDVIVVTKDLAAMCGRNNISSGKAYDTDWTGAMGGQTRSICFIPQGIAINVGSVTPGFTKAIGDITISSFKFSSSR